jgi:hypothetical protein
MKCDHDLAECSCEDLESRFAAICQSKFLHIGEDYEKRIRARIEQNKREQSKPV